MLRSVDCKKGYGAFSQQTFGDIRREWDLYMVRSIIDPLWCEHAPSADINGVWSWGYKRPLKKRTDSTLRKTARSSRDKVLTGCSRDKVLTGCSRDDRVATGLTGSDPARLQRHSHSTQPQLERRPHTGYLCDFHRTNRLPVRERLGQSSADVGKSGIGRLVCSRGPREGG